MPRGPLRSPEALRDLEQIVDYISLNSTEVAHRLLQCADESFRFLQANREAGQECRFKAGGADEIRVWPVQGFRNFLIFYRPSDEGVEILRVLHGARDIESLFGDH